MTKILNPFRIIFYLLNILIILSFIFLIFSAKGIKQNDTLEALVEKSKDKYEKTFNEYSALKRKIELFKKNEYYQLRVIHREIGYIKDNERIYIFDKK